MQCTLSMKPIWQCENSIIGSNQHNICVFQYFKPTYRACWVDSNCVVQNILDSRLQWFSSVGKGAAKQHPTPGIPSSNPANGILLLPLKSGTAMPMFTPSSLQCSQNIRCQILLHSLLKYSVCFQQNTVPLTCQVSPTIEGADQNVCNKLYKKLQQAVPPE